MIDVIDGVDCARLRHQLVAPASVDTVRVVDGVGPQTVRELSKVFDDLRDVVQWAERFRDGETLGRLLDTHGWDVLRAYRLASSVCNEWVDVNPDADRLPGGVGLPALSESVADDRNVWLYTCCRCGYRWLNPDSPPWNCRCGGSITIHTVTARSYREILWRSSRSPSPTVKESGSRVRLVSDGGVDVARCERTSPDAGGIDVDDRVIERLRDCWWRGGNPVLGRVQGVFDGPELDVRDWTRMLRQTDGTLVIRADYCIRGHEFTSWIGVAEDRLAAERTDGHRVTALDRLIEGLRHAAVSPQTELRPALVEDSPFTPPAVARDTHDVAIRVAEGQWHRSVEFDGEEHCTACGRSYPPGERIADVDHDADTVDGLDESREEVCSDCFEVEEPTVATDGGVPECRRRILAALAERIDPGESRYVRADHLDDLDIRNSRIGKWLSVLAGRHLPYYPAEPTPVFEFAIWVDSSSRRVWHVERPAAYRATDRVTSSNTDRVTASEAVTDGGRHVTHSEHDPRDEQNEQDDADHSDSTDLDVDERVLARLDANTTARGVGVDGPALHRGASGVSAVSRVVTGDLSRGWLDGVDWVRMLDQTDDLVLRVEPNGEGQTTWIGHVDEEFVGLRYGTRIGFGDEVVEHIGIAVDRDDATVHPVPVEASPFEDDRDDWDYEELTQLEKVTILREYAFESPVDGTRRTALDRDDIVWGVFDGEPSREDCDTLMRLAADAPKFKLRDLPDRGRCLVVDEHRTGLGPTDSRRRRIEIVRHRRQRERDVSLRSVAGDTAEVSD